jgi:hypothetical protein
MINGNNSNNNSTKNLLSYQIDLELKKKQALTYEAQLVIQRSIDIIKQQISERVIANDKFEEENPNFTY